MTNEVIFKKQVRLLVTKYIFSEILVLHYFSGELFVLQVAIVISFRHTVYTTTTTILRPSGFCPGLPDKQNWFTTDRHQSAVYIQVTG